MIGHTPAPWVARMVDSQEWHIDSRHYAQTGIGTWNGLAVAYGCDAIPNEGARVAEANARLIAAAPELLSSHGRLLANFRLLLAGKPVRDVAEMYAEAEAAIAKATGETP